DGVRSALDNTDWHEVEEEHFANHMAQKINQEAVSGALPEIVIIAPPLTLGEIRKKLSIKAQSKISGEIAKDLTRHSIGDIEKSLMIKLS
ncbi:MAG: host attachment protein, partial [Methylocystis sp.]